MYLEKSETIRKLLDVDKNNNTFCILKDNTIFIIGRRFSGKTTYAQRIAVELYKDYGKICCVFSLSYFDYKNCSNKFIHHKICSNEFFDKISKARKNLKCIIINDNPEKNNIIYNKHDNILLIQTVFITNKIKKDLK